MITDLYEMAFNTIQADRDLVVRFFVVMSRFEYAAKKVGYKQAKSDDFMPAWRRLGAELNAGHSVYTAPEVEAAIAYLLENPPKKLNSNMEWTSRILYGEGRLAQAFDAVVRVRNNLFHGRKGDQFERNNCLLHSSLLVIEAVMQDRAEILEEYLKAY